MKNINYGNLEMVSVLRLALGECHRIMVKVDAFLARCNQLEVSLTTASTSRSRLLEDLLHEALEPAGSIMEAAE